MNKNILNELVNGILEIMRPSLAEIVLYGSVARGTDTEDMLSDFIVDMNLKYDRVFSVIDIDYAMFLKWKGVTPFYQNVAKDGIVLWSSV